MKHALRATLLDNHSVRLRNLDYNRTVSRPGMVDYQNYKVGINAIHAQ